MSVSAVEVERPRLLFFSARSSGPARRVEGFLAQVLQGRHNHETFRLHRIDVGERPDLAERFEVAKTPTLIVVADRAVRGRLEVPRGCADIRVLLEPWLR